MALKIWFPLIDTGGGANILTDALVTTLKHANHLGVQYTARHAFQYFPWGQKRVAPPQDTDLTVTHSWFGLAFDRSDIPLIVVEHLFTPDQTLRPYRTFPQTLFHEIVVRHYVSESYRRAAATVAVSEATREQIRHRFPWSRPRLIRNGVDLEFFYPPPKPRPHKTGRAFRLLFVGNLIRRKGVDILPKIMRQLGDGFELYYTSGLRTDTTLASMTKAHSTGRLDRQGMRQAYWEADVLLFPSRLEGLSLAVMEAAACGLPAIVSDASSLPESVVDGVSGRVCPVNDVAAFVAVIRELAVQRKALVGMGEAARALAEQRFDLRRMTQQYIELFAETVSC